MDITELKNRFGAYKLCNETLEKLGYTLEDETVNLWKDPQNWIELRWDRGRNCYYNQNSFKSTRIDVKTIDDLIDLYNELGATDELLNRNWYNLR